MLLNRWPIRNKLLIGIGLLIVIVATLGWSGFHGVYAYRSLVRSLSGRAAELPLAAALSRQVSTLRITVGEIRGVHEGAGANAGNPLDKSDVAQRFLATLTELRATLEEYRRELAGNGQGDLSINDSRQEWQTVRKIDDCLAEVDRFTSTAGWLDRDDDIVMVDGQLQQLQNLAAELPNHLHARIREMAGDVRGRYRTWIVLTWLTSIAAGVLMTVFIRLFYVWVFRPLRVLVKGSRRVAGGEFGYRITLHTRDEMSELADALNDMTARFEHIRDDLDRQVQERTKQVVRSEQLASVGFLAAGVAHEINNPLASIALCAESLEGRIDDALSNATTPEEEKRVIRHYLQMIQNEAFRCKGITERLLDFARMGDVKHHTTDLGELVQGVIDMVGHLGKYQDKHIEFLPSDAVLAPVNAQEIKQVVLNLLTNGLDSLAPGGKVRVEVRNTGGQAELVFTDNGCGMTEEVREHLFEPFFTRRRTGQGIGLGLSITYRIIADHDGRIDVHSDGPDRGSQFRVVLPLTEKQKEQGHRYQAA